MPLDLAAIFGAGLLTLVTPCVLPLIPIYFALLLNGATNAQGRAGGRGGRLALFFSTLLFGAGLMVVFVGLGLTATSLGTLLHDHRQTLLLAGGLIIFLFGLRFLGVLKISWLEQEKRLDDRRLLSRSHWLNALVMGVVFGLGWTPCIGPILGSVLTYTASATANPWQGALYLATYGAGFVLPLLVLSLLGDSARSLVRRLSPWLPRLERVTGALLAGVGLYLIFSVGGTPAAAVLPRTVEPVAQAQGAAAAPAAVSPPLGSPSVRPRLVEFFSPDCAICRQMIPTVGVIENECDGRKVDVLKVDVSQPALRRLAEAYQVRGVPTFVFLDSQGNDVARLVGYQSLGSLRQSLSAVVGEQCAGLGLFEQDSPQGAPAEGSCPASRAATRCGG